MSLFKSKYLKIKKDDLKSIIKSITIDDLFKSDRLSVDATSNNAYKTSIWVYVCTNLIARNIARIPIQFFKNDKLIENNNDEVVKLFNYVNPFFNKYQLIEGTEIYKQINGNAYWHLITNDKKIFEIELLDPMSMRIETDSTGNINNYKYKGVIDIPPDEVLHFKFFNPFSNLYGFNPVIIALLSIVPDNLSRKYVKKLYENFGQLGGYLETDTSLQDDQFNRIIKQFEDRHKGSENAGKIALLDSGLKYKEAKLTLTDLQFIEQKKVTKAEIHAIYNVNMGLTGDTGTYNKANLTEIKKDFWIQNLLPEMEYLENVINSNMFNVYYPGYTIQFDRTKIDALQDDINNLVESATKLFAMGFTANEINKRLRLGFEKDEKWRDKWWINFGMQPADDYTQITDNNKSAKKETIRPQNDAERKIYKQWKAVQNDVLPIEKQLYNKLKRYFFELRKTMLANLNKKYKSVKIDMNDLDLYNYDNQVKDLQKTIMPYIIKGIDTGGQGAINELKLDISFNLYSENVVEYIKKKNILVKDIFDTVDKQFNKEFRAILEQGYIDGLTENEIASQIEDSIKHITTSAQKRSQTIARTEINQSVNYGRFDGMKQSGINKVKWIQSFDKRVRPNHKISETINMGQEFSNGLHYPGDLNGSQSNAGNIINCRCTLGAVE